MAEIVNLRAVRKARAREAAKAEAEANALKFGRTKAEKLRDALGAAKDAARLDGHKRDDEGPKEP